MLELEVTDTSRGPHASKVIVAASSILWYHRDADLGLSLSRGTAFIMISQDLLTTLPWWLSAAAASTRRPGHGPGLVLLQLGASAGPMQFKIHSKLNPSLNTTITIVNTVEAL